MFDYAGRLARAQARLRDQGLDAMVIAPTSDSQYLFGYPAHASERLTAFVVPAKGQTTVVVPRFEAPRLERSGGGFAIQTWEETESPIDLVAGLLQGARRVAVSDQMWAVFLLRLQAALPGVTFLPSESVMIPLRARKGPDELAVMREGQAVLDEVFELICREPFAGRTEAQIAQRLRDLLLERGHSSVEFAIVASGPNGASPHHLVSDRAIQPGDSVVMDYGGHYRGGLSTDITRTVHVGEPDAEYRRVYDTVNRAREAGIAAVRAGVPAEAVDAAARAVIAEAGYGDYFIHRFGHGIGIDGHEHPYIVAGNRERLEPGMVFSAEPGIYIPGRYGVRIEDIVCVGPDGAAENLNCSTRELVIVR